MASSALATLLITLLAAAAILALLAPACMAASSLQSPGTLGSGQSLTYGSYQFIIQHDCNLVLYANGGAIWASGTNGRASDCYLAMQNDGNLVVYTPSNRPIWASNTNRGNANYLLILQADRNVVVYGPSGAIWATGTNIHGTPGVTIVGYDAKNTTTTADSVTPARVTFDYNAHHK